MNDEQKTSRSGGTPGDEIDGLLREWHALNAAKAAAGRDQMMARLAEMKSEGAPGGEASGSGNRAVGSLSLPPLLDDETDPELNNALRHGAERRGTPIVVIRRIVMNRYSPLAAALIVLAALAPFLMPPNGTVPFGPSVVKADDHVQYSPDGGRLEALDEEGNSLGPCVLAHTDVDVAVSGFMTRVTVTQKYRNPNPDKIEAVYTFPLSERAAVDRMTMVIGDRVIEGQVKERAEARRVYAQAKAAGRIASLLEQERPNIFTQSIANIEPGAEILITLSYVETLKQNDGTYTFAFPTTVAPRYIPGTPVASESLTWAPNYRARHGLVLLAPATISGLQPGDLSARPALSAATLSAMLQRAQPIQRINQSGAVWYNFQAAYADGSAEQGTLYTDGTGVLNSRWFVVPPAALPGNPVNPDGNAAPGSNFAPDTDKVPDASRITPMPVRPPNRAGQDISITVHIDTGGPAISDVDSALHRVEREGGAEPGSPTATVRLANLKEIPNRDFVLTWKQAAATVEPTVFTHTGEQGNFFAINVLPPARVEDDAREGGGMAAMPREVVFVLDTSGSMKGRPIEKAKEVLDKALLTLRPGDTFNIYAFSNSLRTLWAQPRRATPENMSEARSFYAGEPGTGGTEMMKAINAALQPPAYRVQARRVRVSELNDLPADGREVILEWNPQDVITDSGQPGVGARTYLRVRDGVLIYAQNLPGAEGPRAIETRGLWVTANGTRMFAASNAPVEAKVNPLRLVVFLTDGEIGNDMEALAAVRAARDFARVFPFAIGNAANRYLLDGMARLGRGEVEYVLESSNADEAIARFAKRINTPVLTDIKVEFSPNLRPVDTLTALGDGAGAGDLGSIPDLFDCKPLTILGRYNAPGRGTVTISGMTASGPWTRTVNLDLPAHEGAHDTIATLWARTKVESLMNQDLNGAQRGVIGADIRNQVVALGESFGLLTQYTSFVAVDRLRVTIGGVPRLVQIPIELPEDASWEGNFGGRGADEDDVRLYGYPTDWPAKSFERGDGRTNGPLLGGVAIRGSRGGVDGTSPMIAATVPAAAPPAPVFQDSLGLGHKATEPKSDAKPAGDDFTTGFQTRSRKLAPDPASGGQPAGASGGGAGKPADTGVQAPPASVPSKPSSTAEARREVMKDKASAPGEKKVAMKNTKGDGVGSVVAAQNGGRLENKRDRNEPDFSASELLLVPNDAEVSGIELQRLLLQSQNGGGGGASSYRYQNEELRKSEELNLPMGAQPPHRVRPEEAAIAIASFVKQDKIDDARKVAVALAQAYPAYDPGVQMNTILGDDSMKPAERSEKIAALGAKAEADLKELERRRTLARRLDREFYPLFLQVAKPEQAPGVVVPTSPDIPAILTGLAGNGATVEENRVLVTILVASTDDKTLAALKGAGLTIESVSRDTSVVVGMAPIGKVVDLALLEGVRRVEPTRGEAPRRQEGSSGPVVR